MQRMHHVLRAQNLSTCVKERGRRLDFAHCGYKQTSFPATVQDTIRLRHPWCSEPSMLSTPASNDGFLQTKGRRIAHLRRADAEVQAQRSTGARHSFVQLFRASDARLSHPRQITSIALWFLHCHGSFYTLSHQEQKRLLVRSNPCEECFVPKERYWGVSREPLSTLPIQYKVFAYIYITRKGVETRPAYFTDQAVHCFLNTA